jgi:hypothetical protein
MGNISAVTLAPSNRWELSRSTRLTERLRQAAIASAAVLVPIAEWRHMQAGARRNLKQLLLGSRGAF